jgi:hypothetical protein
LKKPEKTLKKFENLEKSRKILKMLEPLFEKNEIPLNTPPHLTPRPPQQDRLLAVAPVAHKVCSSQLPHQKKQQQLKLLQLLQQQKQQQ